MKESEKQLEKIDSLLAELLLPEAMSTVWGAILDYGYYMQLEQHDKDLD